MLRRAGPGTLRRGHLRALGSGASSSSRGYADGLLPLAAAAGPIIVCGTAASACVLPRTGCGGRPGVLAQGRWSLNICVQ